MLRRPLARTLLLFVAFLVLFTGFVEAQQTIDASEIKTTVLGGSPRVEPTPESSPRSSLLGAPAPSGTAISTAASTSSAEAVTTDAATSLTASPPASTGTASSIGVTITVDSSRTRTTIPATVSSNGTATGSLLSSTRTDTGSPTTAPLTTSGLGSDSLTLSISSLSISDISSTSTRLRTTTSTFTTEEEPVEPTFIVVSSVTITTFRPSRTRVPGVVYTDDPYTAAGGINAAPGTLNTSAIVGIALGLTGLTVLIAFGILYFRSQKRKDDAKKALAAEAGFTMPFAGFDQPPGNGGTKLPEMALAGAGSAKGAAWLADRPASQVSMLSAPPNMIAGAHRPVPTIASASSSLPSAATWDPAMRASAAAALGFNRMSGPPAPAYPASSAGSATVRPPLAPSSTARPSVADTEVGKDVASLASAGGATMASVPVAATAAGGSKMLSPQSALGDGARLEVASMAESYDAFSFVETIPELLGPPAPTPVGPPPTNVKERTAAKRLAIAAANAHLYTNAAAHDTASIMSREGRSVAPSFVAPSLAPSLVDRSASPLPTVDHYLGRSRGVGGLTADDASSIHNGAPLISRRLPSTMSASTLQSAVVRALNYPTVPAPPPVVNTSSAASLAPTSSPPESPTKTKGPRPIGSASPPRPDSRGDGADPPSPAPSGDSKTGLLADHPQIKVDAAPPPVRHPPNTFFVDVGRPFSVSLALAPAASPADYLVTLKSGKPVPSWLHLDYKTGMLGGTPYFHSDEWYDVEVLRDGEEVPLRQLRIVLQESGHDDGRSEYASIWAESIRD